ncbi:hypothetical protein ABW19_dt0201810 [Dactylella cylindrospora]|nr:hypothetical protein ABW19_dt0201810 [Dactylella cylindrospora]
MTERPPALHNDEYTVGWICALPLELGASCAVLDVVHAEPIFGDYQSQDENAYVRGSIGGHNIVMACLPKGQYANVAAAIVARDMNASFRGLRFCFMVGIGGGVPDKKTGIDSIRLGDVVVGTPELDLPGVVKVDLVKKEANSERRVGVLNAPPHLLLTIISRLQASEKVFKGSLQKWIDQVFTKHPTLTGDYGRPPEGSDILYKTEYSHNGDPGTSCDNCDKSNTVSRDPRKDSIPAVHYGIIATGDAVIKNAAKREQLREKYNAKCVEMEAAGVLTAIKVGCLVIRGICDYSDTHKNKGWQGYAALTAAAYAKELLQSVPPQSALFRSPLTPPGPMPDPRSAGNQGYFRPPLPTPPTSFSARPYPEARYSVTAIYSDELGHHVWFQDSKGIFETTYDENANQWKSRKIDITDAASYTPLAAVALAGGRDVQVALNSKLAVVESSGTIRVFYQGVNGNNIQECSSEGSYGGWGQSRVTLPAALSGSNLAVACYRGDTGLKIHIYYQDPRMFLKEIIYDGSKYESGEFLPVLAPSHTPITACAMLLNDAQVAMFWKSKEGSVSEWSLPSKRVKELEKTSSAGTEVTIAAVAAGSVADFNRSLFVFQAEGILYEERWFADGDTWEEAEKIELAAS